MNHHTCNHGTLKSSALKRKGNKGNG
jgi:hypothetical protein